MPGVLSQHRLLFVTFNDVLHLKWGWGGWGEEGAADDSVSSLMLLPASVTQQPMPLQSLTCSVANSWCLV